jgi:hypothetical protein
MDYTHQPVSSLLRGPMLHTPQGWVVLASIGAYLILALLFWLGAIGLPLGKNLGSVVVVCLFWPFITFLLFVKHNISDFSPSWRSCLFCCHLCSRTYRLCVHPRLTRQSRGDGHSCACGSLRFALAAPHFYVRDDASVSAIFTTRCGFAVLP